MKKIEWSEWQDAIVRKIYSTHSFAERRRVLKAHMPKLHPLNRHHAYNRAIELNILKPLTKPAPWTDAEIDIVEQRAHQKDATIVKALKAKGFMRTVHAVHVYRQRYVTGIRQGKIDAGIYTACQVGEIVGASSKTVIYWMQKGWLKAKRGDQHGPHVTYEVKASDLREFIIHHVAYCDLGRADKFTLIDILCPHGAKEAGRAAA